MFEDIEEEVAGLLSHNPSEMELQHVEDSLQQKLQEFNSKENQFEKYEEENGTRYNENAQYDMLAEAQQNNEVLQQQMESIKADQEKLMS